MEGSADCMLEGRLNKPSAVKFLRPMALVDVAEAGSDAGLLFPEQAAISSTAGNKKAVSFDFILFSLKSFCWF